MGSGVIPMSCARADVPMLATVPDRARWVDGVVEEGVAHELAVAYWSHFLAGPDSDTGSEAWEAADGRCSSGNPAEISLLVELVRTAPSDADGWLSYLLAGPLSDLWRATTDAGRTALIGASRSHEALKEACDSLIQYPGGDNAP
jgi:hypothetical protein